MPFNGSGQFLRVYSWVTDAANNVLVSSSRMDTDTDGIATGLSNCITKDGQQTLTANIPFGGFKITGLGNGSSTTDSVNYAQVFTSPTFTTPSAAATPATGNSSTLLATTAFVAATAFSSALPAQTGNSGKVVTTNGTTASWSSDPIIGARVYLAATAGGM